MPEPGDAQVPDQIARTGADTITLVLEETTTDHKSGIARRTFELSADNKKVIIGRSSKTVSKGLIPAGNNGYFDNPVVSREHAVIEADLDEGVVRLTDAKSLHGTSINGGQLTAGVPVTLSNGDQIRFGVHVSRALDIFYPTDCKVDIVCHPQPAAPVFERARSYCAPESVDDSDSESSESDGCGSNTDDPLPKSDEATSDEATSGEEPQASFIEALLVADFDDDDNDDEPSFDTEMELEESSSSGDDGFDENDEDHEIDNNEFLSTLKDHKKDISKSIYGDNDDDDDDDDDDELGFDTEMELEESSSSGNDEFDENDEDHEIDNNEFLSMLQDKNKDIVKSICGDDDDGAGFLEQEIRQFMNKANKQDKLVDHEMHQVWSQAASSMLAPELAVPSSSATTFSANKKLDISSILNPSLPTSSVSGADDATKESAPMPPALFFAAATNGLIHCNEYTLAPSFSCAPTTPAPVSAVEPVTPVAAVAPVTPAVDVCEPRPAPTKTATKRKMDQVVAEDAQIEVSAPAPAAATEAMAQTPAPKTAVRPAMPTPPADQGPASKRQATPRAVAAKSQIKSRAWAAAETIGIAALGGAVVLGSLIYTAPTF